MALIILMTIHKATITPQVILHLIKNERDHQKTEIDDLLVTLRGAHPPDLLGVHVHQGDLVLQGALLRESAPNHQKKEKESSAFSIKISYLTELHFSVCHKNKFSVEDPQPISMNKLWFYYLLGVKDRSPVDVVNAAYR
jgi:hypothetical protein